MSIYDKASLVLIPSGTKTSKVYSQVPTNGDGDFTFSRSTAATRVNASGNIEKETQNLLRQSNDFNNSAWLNYNTTRTSGQAGYDGSSDAWLFEKSAANGRIVQTLSQSGVQTFSTYAKAGSLNWLKLQVYDGTSLYYAHFDLANGVLGSGVGLIDRSITSVGGGWYRCSISININNQLVYIYPADGNNDTSGTSGNIYIQDAQVEQGLVTRDYIETTTAIYGGITDNVPRLDYTDSSCPALLLEPQRTNIVPNGDYIEDLRSRSGSIVTSNYGTSPEGYQNSTRVQKASSSDGYQYFTYSVNPSTAYTMSVYAKGSGTIRWNFYDGTSAQSSPFTNLTSEWVRYTFTATSNSTTSNGDFGFFISDDAEVYGFQMEAGSYATSYIPTYGSAVTRNGDDFSDNGYQSKGIFGVDSGSIFLDFGTEFTIFDGVSNSSPTDLFQFVDITSYGGGYMRLRGGESNHYLQLVSMGAADNTLSFTDQTKYCICWDSNGVDFYGDGALIQSTTITNAPSFDRLERGITGNGREGRVKEVLFFPTKLSSQEAIDLTTI